MKYIKIILIGNLQFNRTGSIKPETTEERSFAGRLLILNLNLFYFHIFHILKVYDVSVDKYGINDVIFSDR